MRKIISFVVAGMMFLSFFACADPQVIHLNCSLVTTISGSAFPTNTVQNPKVVRIDLLTGRVTGGGIASLISEASEFQPQITDLEIKGYGRGVIAWLGPESKMTRGVFTINRVSGKYFANSRFDFSQGGFREDFEEGTCSVGKRAF